MIRHPYTLEHVATALHDRWKGAHLVEAWSQEKFIATLVFAIGDELRTFYVDVSPDGGTIVERAQAKRARTNTIDIFDDVMDDVVVMVTKHPDDRIITIWFADYHLHIELFSSGKGNIVLVSQGVVVDALRERSTRVKQPFLVRTFVGKEPLTELGQTCVQSLSNSSLRLGPQYAEEVCHRCNVVETTLVESIDEDQRRALLTTAQSLILECAATSTFLLLRRGEEILFSLVVLQGWTIADTFSDVLETIRITLAERRRSKLFHDKQRVALKLLENDLKKLERSIEGMTSDAAKEGRSDKYRMWADLLLSQQEGFRTGLSTLTVEDNSGVSITIPLQANKSIIDNAKLYYNKARSSATAARSREDRLPTVRKRRDEVALKIEKLRSATSIFELQNAGPAVNEQTTPTRDESNGRFRVFVIDDDHTLYVGKNAANNDELTMRFAKQNDWWFHARGASGSHAVLRGVSAEKIPKPVLEKAAAITAYYSQARNASYVSVVYTQRKYVRKPKGSNVGAVVLEREQTVMVKPSLSISES
ncbi:MAG: DUF814 domain-containing protein [Candidatus Kapabacteria bacterium]|nr:DUF814 domain-containing protein [Candidatus Kapabacteria bacterium]